MITRRLNQEGIPTFRRRGAWQDSAVVRILGNQAAIGILQIYRRSEEGRVKDGAPVPGYFPPVISEDLYWRVQAAKETRKQAPGRRGEGVTNLFQGLAKCRECGSTMTSENKGIKGGGRYLICNSFRRSAGCGNSRRWRLVDVEGRVVSGTHGLDVRAVSERKAKPNQAADRVVGLRATLEKERKAQERILDLVESGHESARERFEEREENIKSLRRQLADAEREASMVKALPSLASRLDAVSHLWAEIAEAAPDQRAELRAALAQALRDTMVVVRFGSKSIEVEYRPDRAPPRSALDKLHPRPSLLRRIVYGDPHPDQPLPGDDEDPHAGKVLGSSGLARKLRGNSRV
jgi:hypothetical protein